MEFMIVIAHSFSIALIENAHRFFVMGGLTILIGGAAAVQLGPLPQSGRLSMNFSQ
jgi:hypothetical protein